MAPAWGLRFLKLIITRKLAFAGTAASVLTTVPASVEALAKQFEMPPLARLAQLHESLDEKGLVHLREVLRIADRFTGALRSRPFREEARGVASAASSSERFDEYRVEGRRLSHALETIFFESELLRERSIHYLAF